MEEKAEDGIVGSVGVYGCDGCDGEWFVDEVRYGIVLFEVVEEADTVMVNVSTQC